MVTLVVAVGTGWMLPGIFHEGVQLVGLFQAVETLPYQMAVGAGDACTSPPTISDTTTTPSESSFVAPTQLPINSFVLICYLLYVNLNYCLSPSALNPSHHQDE